MISDSVGNGEITDGEQTSHNSNCIEMHQIRLHTVQPSNGVMHHIPTAYNNIIQHRHAPTGQALVEQLGAEVVEVQVDVVFVLAHAAALPDLHGHRAADHVAGGEVLGGGGVALHKSVLGDT